MIFYWIKDSYLKQICCRKYDWTGKCWWNVEHAVYCFEMSSIYVCMLTMPTICNRTFWTGPWMMPCSRHSLNSKSQGRVGWTGQLPSSLPPPSLNPRATAWAPSMLTMTTAAALSGQPTSGARVLSPNRNSSPSGPTAPWAWRSPAAACSPRLDSWRTWRLSPLLLLWLHHRASLPHLPSQPRFNQWCPPIVTRQSCAVASRRLAPASMAVSASLPTARQSCADCTATPSTRRSPAEPSTTLATAPTARAATSSMRTESAEVRYCLPNSRTSSNQIPQIATSSARVSASPGSWAPRAAHPLRLSILPSMTLTWGSAVLPLFLHLLLISSPQCLVTPCSGMQQHSSSATIRPAPALKTSTTFLSSWSQRPHAVCVAMEITLTATTAESLPAWRTGTTRTAPSCFLVLEATEDSGRLLDSSVSPRRTPWRTATAAAAEVPVEPSLQRSTDRPPRGWLCLNVCPCLTKWIQRERTEENWHLVNYVCLSGLSSEPELIRILLMTQ